MGDVRLVVKRLALGAKAQPVEAKAFEYMRLASARLGPSGLGKAEVCKAAVCVDLACTTLQVSADPTALILGSGVTGLVYRNARAQLQKVLGVRARATPRDLVARFGCIRLELPLRTALAAFRGRYLAALPPGECAGVDLATPAFLGATFFLLCRRHRVKVEKDRLQGTLGLTSMEFGRAVALVEHTIPDLVGAPEEKEKKKRKSSGGDGDGDDGEEEEADGVAGAEGEGQGQEGAEKEQQQVKKAAPKKRRKKTLTEADLRDAVLGFAATETRRTRGAAARAEQAPVPVKASA